MKKLFFVCMLCVSYFINADDLYVLPGAGGAPGYFNTIQDPTFRVQGIAAIISVMIFLLYFAREAFLPKTDTSG